MQYRAFEPDIEVLGTGLMAAIGGFGPLRSIVERVLHRYGLLDSGPIDATSLDVDVWYPQQTWLDALNEVDKRFGTEILFNMGAEVPNNVAFPPSVVDAHTAVQSIDLAYHLNHRRGGQLMYDAASQTMLEGIGHYGYERFGPDQILSTCETPYPCEYDFGIVATIARRFEPRAIAAHVGSQCRRRGAQACTYSLRWT